MAHRNEGISELCDRTPGFDQDLNRFLAMREVVNAWKGDPHKSDGSSPKDRIAKRRETR
jgi:hypothetical protein